MWEERRTVVEERRRGVGEVEIVEDMSPSTIALMYQRRNVAMMTDGGDNGEIGTGFGGGGGRGIK